MAIVRRRFPDLALAAVIVLGADLLLFHAGLYFPMLAPRSYAGRFEQILRRREELRRLQPGMAEVLLVGNSTMAAAANEGQVERLVRAAGLPLRVSNIAGGGAGARAWYIHLGALALQPAETRLVVIGIHPGLYTLKSARDLEISKSRVRAADLLVLARAAPSVEEGLSLAFSAAFRWPLFREDLNDLLASPRARREAIAQMAREDAWVRRGYRPTNRTRRQVPPVPRGKPKDVRPEPSPEFLHFVERTVRRVHARGVPVVLAAMPGSPYQPRCRGTEGVRRLVAALQGEGVGVDLYEDEGVLDALERPECFSDPLHVNGRGADLYSNALGADIALRLQPRGSARADVALRTEAAAARPPH